MPLLIYASRSSSHHDRWPWPGFRADIGRILLWGLPLTTVVTLACYFVAKRMTKTVFAVGTRIGDELDLGDEQGRVGEMNTEEALGVLQVGGKVADR